MPASAIGRMSQNLSSLHDGSGMHNGASRHLRSFLQFCMDNHRPDANETITPNRARHNPGRMPNRDPFLPNAEHQDIATRRTRQPIPPQLRLGYWRPPGPPTHLEYSTPVQQPRLLTGTSLKSERARALGHSTHLVRRCCTRRTTSSRAVRSCRRRPQAQSRR